MVLLVPEQRYSVYSLLSCHIFCLFDSTSLYLKVCYTLILNKLMETLLFAHWGGGGGGAARRSNVSDYVYRRHQQGLKCSCLTDKQSCKHIENAHSGIHLFLNYRSEVLVVKATPLVYSSV